MKSGKEAKGIEFVLDTGCECALVIPAFLSNQLGLDAGLPTHMTQLCTGSGENLEAPTFEVLLTIGNIPIRTTATVSGTAAEKAVIGTELLSLFDVQFQSDSCRISLTSSK